MKLFVGFFLRGKTGKQKHRIHRGLQQPSVSPVLLLEEYNHGFWGELPASAKDSFQYRMNRATFLHSYPLTPELHVDVSVKNRNSICKLFHGFSSKIRAAIKGLLASAKDAIVCAGRVPSPQAMLLRNP